MSVSTWTRFAIRGLAVALLAVCLQSVSLANESFSFGEYDAPRMATFDDANAGTVFALSISLQAEPQPQSSDVVIYVDTSASQTGVFKKDSIATLKQLLGNLSVEDRVKLVAMDLEPVSLTQNFVRPDSDAMMVAIENLQSRIALGSTDMGLMLSSATGHFENTAKTRNRNVVYIGDGVSRSGFLKSERFVQANANLLNNRVSFSSYAIGPERDVEFLAALANNTGGNFFVDSDNPQAMQSGAKGLADTVHGTVFWPAKSALPTHIKEIYPGNVPPLRSDRDSILIGTLAKRGDMEFTLNGMINGESKSMTWPVSSEVSNVDFAFLPKLVSDARVNDGATLPTAGSNGLREIVRVMGEQSRQLAQLGSQALVTGDVKAAEKLAKEALANDPSNTEATLLASTVYSTKQDDDPFAESGSDDVVDEAIEEVIDEPTADEGGDPFGDESSVVDQPVTDAPQENIFGDEAAPQETPVDQPSAEMQEEPTEDIFGSTEETPVPDDTLQMIPDDNQAQPEAIIQSTDNALQMIDPGAQIGRSFPQDEVERLLRDGKAPAESILLEERERIKILTERLTAQVQFELTRARQELATAPGAAVERLKSMLDVVDQSVDVLADRRQDLRARLESALMSSRQRKLAFDDDQALREQRLAANLEYQASIKENERSEEELHSLISRFDSLMKENDYVSAERVSTKAQDLYPDNPTTVAAYEFGRIQRNMELNTELRRRRQVGFLDSLYETEKSATPFAGEPPMIFPDAQVWLEKKARRARFSDVRLTGNANDEKILKALNDDYSKKYEDATFAEVMSDLRDQYGINVVLDQTARDDSLSEDEPITFEVRGIRLKNALRLMLAEKNATFIVRDEVLRIISLDVASDPEYFVTNIYNVGDLIAPRSNIGGFGGGGQQGGGQGRGGGGGGLGGGGGGGAGGMFFIDDTLTPGSVPAAKAASETSSRRGVKQPVMLTPGTNGDWNGFFAKSHPAPSDVRYTVRRLMKQKNTEQAVGLMLGAMKNEQTQPWMYEALVIAMQIGNYPQADIERALMSAVDLSNDPTDALRAANYMAENKMEKRAIWLLKQLADKETTSPEPFVVGLKAAQRIKDTDGIKWATIGILSQAWPKHRHVVKQAIYAAEATRTQLEKDGETAELAEYNKQIENALYRDCIIKVTWPGDADVDLYVEEPTGTVCWRNNPRTTAGGVMMGDEFPAENAKGETSEYYVLPRGFSGEYRLLIRRVWGEIPTGKVSVSIYNNFRTDKETSQQKLLEVDDKGTLVLFELKEGRRAQMLDEKKIETLVDEQFRVKRRVLAQQLNHLYSSKGASEYYSDNGSTGPPIYIGEPGSGNGSGLLDSDLGLGPRSAGYRPEITVIPEGTLMNVNHATTSDRLYVMVSASPFFFAITRVDTFNIFGDAGNAANQGGGIVGGGGGGGGGAGGGGGIGGGGGGGGGLF